MSELPAFAQFFHQDFSLMAPDMVTGARMYLSGLPSERHAILAREFGSFLEEHRSAKVMRNGWFRLGAQYAPRGKSLMARMQNIGELLRNS